MMQIEKSFFDLAEESTKPQNILVICDRGAMDASAYIAREQWDRILEATGNVSPEKHRGGGCYHFDLPLDVKKGIIRLVKYDLPIFQWVQ